MTSIHKSRKKVTGMVKKDFIVRRSITMIEGKPHVETYSESELVRCKDCRFHNNPEERASETCWMPCDEYKTDGNWFCGWGKRKDS